MRRLATGSAAARARAYVLETAGGPAASAIDRVARRSGRRVGLALTYHGLANGDVSRALVATVTPQTFASHARYLRARYRVVPASRLLEAVEARRAGDRFPVSITFDDDLASHVELAAPILRRLGLPATFFLTGASLERPHLFWWELLQVAVDRGVRELPGRRGGPARLLTSERAGETLAALRDLRPSEREEAVSTLRERLGAPPETHGLRTAQVESLVRDGFELGFHTFRHDFLPSLTDAELDRAMTEGRERLEAISGRALEDLAYPHGGFDDRVVEAARTAGYARAFTTEPDPVRPVNDPLRIGRLDQWEMAVGRFALRIARALHAPVDAPG